MTVGTEEANRLTVNLLAEFMSRNQMAKKNESNSA